MDCKKTQIMISSLLDGELGAEDRSRVEGHIARCPACLQEREEMQGVFTLLSSALPSLSPRLAQSITASLPSRPRSAPVAFRWGAVAASLLLAVGLIFFFNSGVDEELPGTDEIARLGQVEGGLLRVTRLDGVSRATSRTAVREGDVLENLHSRPARLTLDVGCELALSDGATVKVTTSEGRTIVELQGDGEVIASLDSPKPSVVVAAAGYTVQALGTIFSVKMMGERVEVRALQGIVTVITLSGFRWQLQAGEMCINGDLMEQESAPPFWAEPALPEIGDLPWPGTVRPSGLPGRPASEPSDMDLPIDPSPRRGE